MNTEKEVTKKAKIIGEVDQAQIDAWKNQYKTRRIPTVKVEDDEGNTHISYFRKPDFEHISMLRKKAKKEEELDALKTITNTLHIGGSEEVMQDYHMCFGTIQAVGELLKATKGALGKQ